MLSAFSFALSAKIPTRHILFLRSSRKNSQIRIAEVRPDISAAASLIRRVFISQSNSQNLRCQLLPLLVTLKRFADLSVAWLLKYEQ